MPVKFHKVFLADERFESCGVFDINNDGWLDIVSGEYWYEGPDFKKRHRIGAIKTEGEYYDDFSTIPMDINGDGNMDYVTGGYWGDTLRWRENPGDPNKEWPEHIIAQTGSVETTRVWDVDGDGQLEIVPNCPGGPVVVYKLITDACGKGTGQFAAYKIWDKNQGHGLGFGDITGRGRMDCLLYNGWLEAPADPYKGEWIFHQDWDLGPASVPILVVDVNGDGLNDVIVGGGHRYGLEWYEQVRTGDKISWKKHDIDPYNSQFHDLQWVDIDGDGQCELVTGKRYRAHNGHDAGAADPVGIYYFKWNGEFFIKEVIDWGPTRFGKGAGIFFAVADLNKNGKLDIVAPGKDGLFIYFNEG